MNWNLIFYDLVLIVLLKDRSFGNEQKCTGKSKYEMWKWVHEQGNDWGASSKNWFRWTLWSDEWRSMHIDKWSQNMCEKLWRVDKILEVNQSKNLSYFFKYLCKKIILKIINPFLSIKARNYPWHLDLSVYRNVHFDFLLLVF